MKKIKILILLFLIFIIPVFGEEVKLTVLATTDLHGQVYPLDYFTLKEKAQGLAKIYTLVKEIRKTNPDTLLIDCGDTLQGSPLEYYHHKYLFNLADPIIQAMNFMKYESMTIGNHDFNFGLKVLLKAKAEAKFPFLSANTYKKNSPYPYFKPYIIKEIKGIKIAILGITTPAIPHWEDKENHQDLVFKDAFYETKKWVNFLKNSLKADLVILAAHMGLEQDLETKRLYKYQISGENAVYKIAQNIPQIDLILMGHTHKDVPSLLINSVLLVQAKRYGERLAKIDFTLKKENKKWKVIQKNAYTLKVENINPSLEILKLTEKYHQTTLNYLNRKIGETDIDLSGKLARFQDTPLMNLINQVQLDWGKADISLASVLNSEVFIPKGEIKVYQIFSLYPYENTLYLIKINGKILKEALEYSAKYFKAFEAYNGKTNLEDLIDPQVPGYNYDIAYGVNYQIDLTKPIGKRIVNLMFKNKLIKDNQEFLLVLNNYRFNSGGGYNMFKNCPVIKKSKEEVRELIIKQLKKMKSFKIKEEKRWEILPKELELIFKK
ncbi:MAG: bifunctional metallophosphatase/5'-nucleotidase [Armatimonadetes bacterium]|nr:bifunctional metallophosphatase/5'-nucleotidase [Armatimonadota bacterium]